MRFATQAKTLVLIAVIVAVTESCGGSSVPATAPESSGTSAPSESIEPASSSPAPNEPSAEASKTEAAAASSENSAKDPNAEREVQYLVTPEGLQIRVEGVRFIASATAERSGAGWGVKLNVDAIVNDDKKHSLLNPKGGPIALAGAIETDGKTERFGDKREGEDDQILEPGKPAKLTRKWPGKGAEKPLVKGQSLELEVGLWGIGDTAETRRPVKNFFHVKLVVGQGKPHALVAPPASALHESE